MQLEEIMNQNNFVIVGDTLNPDKYAYKIKHQMMDHDYHVECVGKELKSINDVSSDIDIIDLCINPIAGLRLLQENTKPFKCIVIQPGAQSDDIIAYLKDHNYDYIEGCLLLGLSLYKK